MEIVEGIHRIDEASDNLAHANVYLVINDGELAVVDTGTPGNAQKIIGYIKKLGYQPTEVRTIILTHFHRDHTGSAKELKDLTNAMVAAYQEDADYISGKKPMPSPKSARSAWSFEPVAVEVILKEGDRVAHLRVFHTPGHTPGSMMLLDEERKVLFAGDTLRYDGKKVSEAPEEFSMDMNLVRESIAKASKLDFEIMLPGHGEPLKTDALERVKRILMRA